MGDKSRVELFFRQYETPKKAEILNRLVNKIIQDVGRTIGVPVAARIAFDKLKGMEPVYSGVEDIRISDNRIRIRLKGGVSEDALTSILVDFFSAIGKSYSETMGSVAKTIIKESLKAFMKEHGKRYPELEGALRKL